MSRPGGEFNLAIASKTSDFLRNNIRELSLLTFIVSVIFFLISSAGLFNAFDFMNKGFVTDLNESLDTSQGNWVIWVFLLSLIGWIVGLGYFLAYYFNAKKFHKLTDTASKATFVRNQDDIEYLAYKLGERYEIKVEELKEELKIRRR